MTTTAEAAFASLPEEFRELYYHVARQVVAGEDPERRACESGTAWRERCAAAERLRELQAHALAVMMFWKDATEGGGE